MEQYSELLSSKEYGDFLREYAEYAELCGYNVRTLRGLAEAIADQFLFREFLNEQLVDA